jgi:hypothetical protein
MKTREINNKYYVDVKVVPIKSNKYADVGAKNWYLPNTKKLILDNYLADIYITSNEEIKEGDWYYNERLNKVFQAIAKSGYNTTDKEFKIIASTDLSLELPQLSKEFIEKFIESYNNGNPIVDVLVEHSPKDCCGGHIKSTCSEKNNCANKIQLKISKDNTITIKKKEETWDGIFNLNLFKSKEQLETYLKENYNPPIKK